MRELNVRLNKNMGEWNFDTLANNFELDDLKDWGFSDFELYDAGLETPDFEPVDESEQPRLDQKSPITCPYCGEEFIPE
jgi:hypothetical protein